jgi:hypothetical protein
MELNNTDMKPKHLAILIDCIEHGCRYGVSRAFKHIEEPSPEQIEEAVESAIMERIHQFYDFAGTEYEY